MTDKPQTASNKAMVDLLKECRRHVVENLTRMYGHSEFGEVRRIDAALEEMCKP